MTVEARIIDWMRADTRVQAVYACGPGVHVEGRIIGYQERPSVVIETDAGERVSWAAHLVKAGDTPTDPVRAVGEELRCDVCGVKALDCWRDPRLPVTYFIRQGLCGPCSRKPATAGDTLCSCCEIDWQLCRGLYGKGLPRCCSDCTHDLTIPTPAITIEEPYVR